MKVNIAVLTVTDTRTIDTDKSGAILVKKIKEQNHNLIDRKIVKDDKNQIKKILLDWIKKNDIDVILTTGGTGFTARDNTQKALQPLFDLHIDGFGELFRQLSYEEIGNSTVQSRVFAGLANGTIIFCLPGSPGACRTGWSKIIADQLDSGHKPCNFVDKLRIE